MILEMAKSETLDQLKTAYSDAYNACNGDLKAQKEIIKGKDAVKARIQAAAKVAA